MLEFLRRLVNSTEKKQKKHENFRPERRRGDPMVLQGRGLWMSVLFIGFRDSKFMASCRQFLSKGVGDPSLPTLMEVGPMTCELHCKYIDQ